MFQHYGTIVAKYGIDSDKIIEEEENDEKKKRQQHEAHFRCHPMSHRTARVSSFHPIRFSIIWVFGIDGVRTG